MTLTRHAETATMTRVSSIPSAKAMLKLLVGGEKPGISPLRFASSESAASPSRFQGQPCTRTIVALGLASAGRNQPDSRQCQDEAKQQPHTGIAIQEGTNENRQGCGQQSGDRSRNTHASLRQGAIQQ